MADSEKIFTDGLIFKAPRATAPSWVKGNISIKVADFIRFLEQHNTGDGWVNIDVKESKGGKMYCELSTWKPKAGGGSRPQGEPTGSAEGAAGDEDIPF